MLKETPTSLRAYFGFIAFLSALPLIGQLAEMKLDAIRVIVGLALIGLYSFVAIRMDDLLSRRPGFIRGVLLMNLFLSGLAAGLGVLGGTGLMGLIPMAVAFAITAYLLSSVARLSREAVASYSTKAYQSAQPTPPKGG